MLTKRIRARTAALLFALLLPGGLAACATAGEDGPFMREDIPWNNSVEPAPASPFLNDALLGDPRYQYQMDWYGPVGRGFYRPHGGGPAPYPGDPAPR